MSGNVKKDGGKLQFDLFASMSEKQTSSLFRGTLVQEGSDWLIGGN